MSTPAVRRIKRGRPDVRLTVLTRSKLADFWRLVPEVDELITIDPGDSIFRVASKIRGRFEVAILFPNSIRAAIEAWLAAIPRRVGYSRPWRDFFVNQFIPDAPFPAPLRHQTGHYLRIADRIGANLGEPLLRGCMEPLNLGWPDFARAPNMVLPSAGQSSVWLPGSSPNADGFIG